MSNINKKILERIFIINDKKYIVFKNDGKTYIKCDNVIVYPEINNNISASQWLKYNTKIIQLNK